MFCECGCGRITTINGHDDPQSGRIKGRHARFILGHQGRKRYKGLTVFCACGCGKPTKIIQGTPNKFVHGHAKNYKTTHGKSKTAEFRAFSAAKTRCTNSNIKHWMDYGGRNIEFLFTSFEQFFAEVGERPSVKHSLDRYPNNDGNYEPGNVRWATKSEQGKNRRRYAALQNFDDAALITEMKRRSLWP